MFKFLIATFVFVGFPLGYSNPIEKYWAEAGIVVDNYCNPGFGFNIAMMGKRHGLSTRCYATYAMPSGGLSDPETNTIIKQKSGSLHYNYGVINSGNFIVLLSAGVSVNYIIWRTNVLETKQRPDDNCNIGGGCLSFESPEYKVTKGYCFGVPVGCEFVWATSARLGLGVKTFANISEYSDYGIMFVIVFGKLR